MRNDCPCNGCVPPKRQIGCHGWCKEYIDWHNEVMANTLAERKERYLTRDIIEMHKNRKKAF